MSKQMYFQEVQALKKQFIEDSKVLEQRLNSLQKKFNSFATLNSFSGKAATNTKNYLDEIHGSLMASFAASSTNLRESFKKTTSEYKSKVDSSDSSIMVEDYLRDIVKKIANIKNDFNNTHSEGKKIIEEVQDITNASYPSATEITQSINKAREQIVKSLEKLAEFEGAPDTGLLESQTMIEALEKGIQSASKSDMSSASTSQMKTSSWFGTLIGGIVSINNAYKSVASNKKYLDFIASGAVRGYIKYGRKLGVTFDVAKTSSGKHKGVYKFAIDDADELAQVAAMLKLSKDKKMIDRLVDVGFKFDVSKKRLKYLKREIYKLPDFKAFQDYKILEKNLGSVKALGKTGLNNFKSELVKSTSKLKAWDWKNQLKDFKGEFSKAGKLGKTMKGLGMVSSVISIGDNIAESQKDGFQLHDIADVATDSAVDVGFNAGAAAAGATVGSAFLPPLGTVIGMGVGIGISAAADNIKWGQPPKSVIEHTKSAVKKGTKWVGNKLKKIFW